MGMGDNEFGQVGVRDREADQISVIVGLQNVGKIKQIAAGDVHSVALTSSGEVYTWGQGKLGQLGLGEAISEPVFEPTKVLGIGRMKKIYVGPNQVFAVEYTNGKCVIWQCTMWVKLILFYAAEMNTPVPELTTGKKRGAPPSKSSNKKGKQ